MTVESVKVLLVEDSKVLAERIVDAIGELPEVDVVGVVDTEANALATLRKRRIDVLLLDLHLKQGTGFGILKTVATMDQKPRIVVLTNHDMEEYQAAAMEYGATYFLDKARDYDRLIEILREIVNLTPAERQLLK